MSLEWIKQAPAFNTITDDMSVFITTDSKDNVIFTTRTSGAVSGGQNIGDRDTAVGKMDNKGNLIWIKQYPRVNTTVYDTIHGSINTDDFDNIYLIYTTDGAISGSVNKGGRDMVIYKLNSSGDLLWVTQSPVLNTSDSTISYSLAVNKSTGEIYGAFSTTGTVSGGTKLGAGSNNDIVIFKLDTNTGAVIWMKQQPAFNTTGDNYVSGQGLNVSPSGYLYVGYVTSGAISGGTNYGNNDAVIIKMDSNGGILWIKQPSQINSATGELQIQIETDPFENVYVSLLTDGALSGGTNKGGNDVSVSKLDSNGNVIWAKQQAIMNTTASEIYQFMTVDSFGNVYVTYSTTGTASGGFNSGSVDVVVFKLDTNGNLSWIKQQALFNTPYSDDYPSIAAYGGTSLYIGYYTTGTVSGGTNIGSFDIVVFKFKLTLPPEIPTIEPYPLVESGKITYWWTLTAPENTSSIVITCGGTSQYYTNTGRQATFSGLTNGVLYSTSIRTYSAAKELGDPVSFVSVKPGTAPSAPLNVVISKSNNEVVVSWDPPASDGGSDIQWYALQSTDQAYTFSIEPYKRTFTSTSIAAGTYTFILYAVNYVDWGTASDSTTLTFP